MRPDKLPPQPAQAAAREPSDGSQVPTGEPDINSATRLPVGTAPNSPRHLPHHPFILI
jgi:hypothetical protein